MSVQFLTNAAGEHTAVLVPIREWQQLQQRLQQAKAPRAAARAARKKELKEEFREALREMKLMQEGKIPKTSAEDFLRELRADV